MELFVNIHKFTVKNLMNKIWKHIHAKLLTYQYEMPNFVLHHIIHTVTVCTSTSTHDMRKLDLTQNNKEKLITKW